MAAGSGWLLATSSQSVTGLISVWPPYSKTVPVTVSRSPTAGWMLWSQTSTPDQGAAASCRKKREPM